MKRVIFLVSIILSFSSTCFAFPDGQSGGGGGSVNLASPGPIGGTVPAAGTFTTINGTYSVQGYGGKCDGTTDDTTAYNSALLAAHTAGGGYVMGCPQTTLISNISVTIPSALTIYSNTWLGHNPSAIINFRNDATVQSVGNMISNYATWHPQRSLTTVSTVAFLSTPAIPTSITVTGANNSGTWSYVIVAVDAKGGVTLPSPQKTTVSGASWASFSGAPTTNYNTVNFAACTGTSCNVYRTAVPTGGYIGLAGSVSNGATSFADQTATSISGNPPTYATSGSVIDVASPDSFTPADIGRSIIADGPAGNNGANKGAAGHGAWTGLISKYISSTRVIVTGLDGQSNYPASWAYTSGSPTTGRIYDRDTNIKITGGKWNSGFASVAGTYPNTLDDQNIMVFSHLDNLKMEDVSLTGLQVAHLALFYDISKVVITRPTLYSSEDGIHFHGPIDNIKVTGVTSNTIDDNLAITCGDVVSVDCSSGNATNIIFDGVVGQSGTSFVKLVSGGPGVANPNLYQRTIKNISISNLAGASLVKTYKVIPVTGESLIVPDGITIMPRYYGDQGWYRLTAPAHGFSTGDIMFFVSGFTPSSFNGGRTHAYYVDDNTIDLKETLYNGTPSVSNATVKGGYSSYTGIYAVDDSPGSGDYTSINNISINNVRIDTPISVVEFATTGRTRGLSISDVTNDITIRAAANLFGGTINLGGVDDAIVNGVYHSNQLISSVTGVLATDVVSLIMNNSDFNIYGKDSLGTLLSINGPLSNLIMNNNIVSTDNIDNAYFISLSGGSPSALNNAIINNSNVTKVASLITAASSGAVVGQVIFNNTQTFGADLLASIQTGNTVNLTFNNLSVSNQSEGAIYANRASTKVNVRGSGFTLNAGSFTGLLGASGGAVVKFYNPDFPGVAPTLSTGSTTGYDAKGIVTGGTSPITLTFAQPFVSSPICQVTPSAGATGNITTQSNTAIIVTGAGMTGFNYLCLPAYGE